MTQAFYKKYGKYTKKHHKAAGTIGAAWRRKAARKKGSLVSRTAKSNRQAIKNLRRNIETKMIDTVNATVANRFGGQWIGSTSVNNNGEFDIGGVTLPAVMRPFTGLGGFVANINPLGRIGDFIHIKSVTYKLLMIAAIGETNRIGCYIVLDRYPDGQGASLKGGAADGLILADGPQASGVIPMCYQNLDTCTGPNCRFKVLKHIQVRVSKGVTGSPVGPLKPSVLVSGTLRLPYKLRYDSSALAPANVEPANQQLLFCFYSDSGAAPHPTVDARMRVRFKDA